MQGDPWSLEVDLGLEVQGGRQNVPPGERKKLTRWLSWLNWQAIVFTDIQSLVIKHSSKETKSRYYLDI